MFHPVCIRMTEPLIQVRDPSRLHCLVMPPPPSRAGGASVSRPSPSSWMQESPRMPCVSSVTHPSLSLAPADSRSVQAHNLSKHDDENVTPGLTVGIPGWTVPGGYIACGLGLGLCNLIAPGYIQGCCHLLVPIWTLVVGLHIITNPASHDLAWVWGGVLTILLLPFVVLVASPLFIGFYLLIFAVFSSGVFWRRLRGIPFILACVCWGGLLVSFVLSVGWSGIPPQMHLCVAAFFSLSLGVLNSGGAKFAMRVGTGV